MSSLKKHDVVKFDCSGVNAYTPDFQAGKHSSFLPVKHYAKQC